MSTELAFPEKSEYWSIVDSNGDILDSGRLEPHLVLTTANPTIVHNQNQNQYINQINAIGAAGPALPEVGTPLTVGEIYVWDAQNVIVRQDHTRTEHDPDTVPALFSVYRADSDGLAWIANENVLVGDSRRYAEAMWECLQSHVTQAGWEPDLVPALWAMSAPEPGAGWTHSVAYNVDDEVTYLNIAYVCLQAHTSQVGWEPPNVPALWSVV